MFNVHKIYNTMYIIYRVYECKSKSFYYVKMYSEQIALDVLYAVPVHSTDFRLNLKMVKLLLEDQIYLQSCSQTCGINP